MVAQKTKLVRGTIFEVLETFSTLKGARWYRKELKPFLILRDVQIWKKV